MGKLDALNRGNYKGLKLVEKKDAGILVCGQRVEIKESIGSLHY